MEACTSGLLVQYRHLVIHWHMGLPWVGDKLSARRLRRKRHSLCWEGSPMCRPTRPFDLEKSREKDGYIMKVGRGKFTK